MNKLKLSAVLVAMATSFTGCATVIDGGTTDMQFTSNVDGVKILMHGGAIGKTPFMGEIPKPDRAPDRGVQAGGRTGGTNPGAGR
mgnify:CR=1 FL=1